MGRPVMIACFALPALLLLAGCAGVSAAAVDPAPAPSATPKTRDEACADLLAAVTAYYDVASPGSTVEPVAVADLPSPNGVLIPPPDCSFEMRPDPEQVVGDVWTIDNFYLQPSGGLDAVISDRLTEAGYQQVPDITSWKLRSGVTSYSAAILLYAEGDGQVYTDAADGAVLDFIVTQG
jgi:hypothetical protein